MVLPDGWNSVSTSPRHSKPLAVSSHPYSHLSCSSRMSTTTACSQCNGSTSALHASSSRSPSFSSLLRELPDLPNRCLLSNSVCSIPEITDADVAAQSDQSASATGYQDKPFRHQYTLFWGVAAQFCYVGAQVAVAGFFIHYVTEVKPSLTTADGSNLLAVAQALFAVGRFVASLMMKWVKPRYILLAFLTGCVIFITAAIPTTGDAAIAMLCMVLFFEVSQVPSTLLTSNFPGHPN